jgi:hypothetical protein
LLKPKLIQPECVEARNIANGKDVTHMLGKDVLAAQPVPPRGKAGSWLSDELLEINVPLKAHEAGLNCPAAHAARRVTPNLSHILRTQSDSFIRSSRSKAAQFRADSDEFAVVIAITPVASLTAPVAIMMIVPIFVIPIVISAVLVGKCYQRSGRGFK